MKRFSWCAARTKWLVQTGLRQREQCSLWRRSWCLIKAARQARRGGRCWAARGSALSPSAVPIFTLQTHGHSAFFVFSQPSALLADGVLWACPALRKGESSGLADNWKGEFELVALPGLVWEDLPAHRSCRSPLWWWAPADFQWAAPRKDYGIFSVISRPNRGHWSKPFTVHSGEEEHQVHVTVLNCRANPLVTHISTMCFSAKELSNRLHFFLNQMQIQRRNSAVFAPICQ